MKYKKIITSGCSFSDPITPYTWPNQLEIYIKKIDSSVRFDHRGLASQGQELIQKKTMHAIHEALSQGMSPEELCVFVMWSSNDRKSFYVDNKDYINTIKNNWKMSSQWWQLQLGDLKNHLDNPDEVTSNNKIYDNIRYNKSGGWLITSSQVTDELPMIREYFMMSQPNNYSGIHSSLENIILLQSFCKLKGIKLYQQYFMDITRNDFESVKNHQIIKYLYDQLDRDSFISYEKSIYNYLKEKSFSDSCFKDSTDAHPNGLGHRIWVDEVIMTHLELDNFFD